MKTGFVEKLIGRLGKIGRPDVSVRRPAVRSQGESTPTTNGE